MSYRITSLDHLKENSTDTGLDCYIALNGFVTSSKLISFEGAGWWILNYIDDSEQEFISDEDLATNTMIVEAIHKGALYAYE